MKRALTNVLLILLPLWTLHVFVFSVVSLNTEGSNSEFAALQQASRSLYALLLLMLSSLLMLVFYRFLKQKTRSFLTAFILLICIMLLLAVSDLPEWTFELSPGAALSFNHEIIPVLLLVLIIATRTRWSKPAPEKK